MTETITRRAQAYRARHPTVSRGSALALAMCAAGVDDDAAALTIMRARHCLAVAELFAEVRTSGGRGARP